MMTFHRLATIHYIGAMCATWVLSGIWNYLSYGYMIGQYYFDEVWGMSDFMLETLLAGFLPGLLAGGSMLIRLRKMRGAVERAWKRDPWTLIIVIIAVCVSHYIFWYGIRALCCGTTW
ncbi:hypothetical protein [Pseudoduganella violaceinigra]|uniref:hypothetical protein n=1 Tax=Pseudoduganella violaceinigra TaxID=246602 RepID=UPI0004871ABD|nr:hypothetical protein [Pseudoduganella violaceinigra]